jgi:SAM-dependent methyltransferase
MYKRLSDTMKSIAKGDDQQVLSISHSRAFCRVLGLDCASILEANYPTHDIRALGFADASFDYVVSDQVLAHVEGDPQDVINETFRVLKPGGVAVHTSCFINPIDRSPGDFWRFSPDALRFLCRAHDVLEVGGWGNPYVWGLVAIGLRFKPVPEKRCLYRRLAMYNDPACPIVTWVVARKR